MNITTYLFFNGCFNETAQLYAKALGGEVSLVYYPGICIPSRNGSDNIQHADIIVKNRMVLQIANVEVITPKSGFAVSASAPSIGIAMKAFNILAIGGGSNHPIPPLT